MKKVYLKDLKPDEVIRRLKAGEVIKHTRGNYEKKLIDGFICTIFNSGRFVINDYLTNDYLTNNESACFEEPEEFKLEVGKCYRTRDGRKAFVSSYNSSTKYFRGAVIDFLNLAVWTEKGLYLCATESGLDLISEWSDDNVAED